MLSSTVPHRWWPVVLIAFALNGCGAAGVQQRAAPPNEHAYAGPHGRPRAYGGGVCAISSPHAHAYPPVPRAAFTVTDAGVVDERARYPFWEPHPHHIRTCFRTKWHLHLEPPRQDLAYDAERDAYRAAPFPGAIALEHFSGTHPRRRCDQVTCTFAGPHGHAACGVRAQAKATMEGGASP